MQDIPDAGLLERFARSGSEEAFAELVRRHLPLVYSAAFRHTANPQNAQEITQAVFIILARKAASLGRQSVLSGWLYHTTRLTAANFQRAEFRRIHREQEAFMQSTMEESAPDAAWRAVAPLLDEAMARLGATDRDAVVLRYFENKSLAEVGTALGVEERAAQKRVARALEKLRKIFSKRGVPLTATVIAGAVSANSVQAAPVGLAVTVTAAAAKGTAVSASIAALVEGTMKMMTWLKMKFWLGLGTAAGVTGAAIVIGIELNAECVTTKPEVEFRAAGVVSISREDDKSGNKAFNFEVFVKGNRWLIRTVPFDYLTNKSDTAIEYYQAGTDGTNVYSAALFNAEFDLRRNQEVAMVKLKEIERQLTASGNNPQALSGIRQQIALLSRQWLEEAAGPSKKPRNGAVGEINVGVVPPFSEISGGNVIAPIWLALCSQSVLGLSGTNLVPGLFHFRYGNESRSTELFVRAEMTNSQRFPYLPAFVGFSNNAVWLAKRAGSQTMITPVNDLASPFQEATYAAAFNSFGELALPSAFEIRTYLAPTSGAKPRPRWIIAGSVTKVSPSAKLADFLPHLPAVAAIADYRHLDDNVTHSVRAWTTPGGADEWPSVETVQSTKEYESQVQYPQPDGQ